MGVVLVTHERVVRVVVRGTASNEIRQDIAKFRTVLGRRIRKATGDHRAALKTVQQGLDRVNGRLFGHPVVRGPNGEVVFVVARTNNCLEQHFGRQNQHIRRRTGRKNLGRDLDDLPAEAALVHNLNRPDYVRVVVGSLDQLPARFAETSPPSRPLRPRPHYHLARHLVSAQIDRHAGSANPAPKPLLTES